MLLDIDQEINFIIQKIIKNTRLAMYNKLKHKLISYTSYMQLFYSFCKDIEIAI